MVIVDRLTKGTVLVPLGRITAEAVARAFLERFVAYHGLPADVVSDRGTQFVSEIWESLYYTLRI
jgi:hypothetical protein